MEASHLPISDEPTPRLRVPLRSSPLRCARCDGQRKLGEWRSHTSAIELEQLLHSRILVVLLFVRGCQATQNS